MNEAQFNFPPLTPNQLAQMGKIVNESSSTETAKVSGSAVETVEAPKAAITQIATSGVINPYAPKIDSPKIETVAVVSPVVPAPIAPLNIVAEQTSESSELSEPARYEPVLGEAEEPITSQIQLFDVSPNLTIEPQTASIIIDNFEPLDAISIAISETGELLKTGSIELPNLSTNTGEIATILDAAQVDEAIAADSVNGYVSTIAPLRASGVVNTAGKIGIMPSRSAKGQGAGFAVLTLSLLMIAAGSLVLAAFMLGLLK